MNLYFKKRKISIKKSTIYVDLKIYNDLNYKKTEVWMEELGNCRLKKNDLFELSIDALGNEGEGIGHLEGIEK